MLVKASAFAFLAPGAIGAARVLAAAPALADAPPDKPADATDAPKKDGDAATTDAATTGGAPAVDPNDPFEDPGKSYYFIGLQYRDAIVPTFMIHWFANGGATVNVPMVGPEFTKRRDGFEVDVAVMYASYAMSPFLFEGKSDPAAANPKYELVASSLGQVYFMADLLGEIPLEKKDGKVGRFSLLIGAGVGMGVVFGNLYRSQAYPNVPNASPNNASQWNACTSASSGPGNGYCQQSNNHYWPSWTASNRNSPGAGAYTEDKWLGSPSGDTPNIFPWIAVPQIGFRYKPIKQLQTKVDFGFSTSGFFFDLSASYGL